MLWVLSLHITTLALWAAAALYVPIILFIQAQHQTATKEAELSADGFEVTPKGIDSIARFAYTHIATPTALISISAGSVVFLLNQSHHFWLLAKLTLVTFLCIGQALLGLLIIRAERGNFERMKLYSGTLTCTFLLLMLAIVWIVLAKPATPVWVESLL